MEDMHSRKRKAGYTLAELLLVIAILVILVTLGVTGFLSLRRKMQIAKYDDLAREIYVAAQNQLTRLYVNGADENTDELLKNGTVLPYDETPSDYVDTDTGSWVKDDYRCAIQRSNVMEELLPLGAVADDVRSNGFYVIEYNIKTRTVYSVFYAGKYFEYKDVATMEGFRESRSTRINPMVGYYGGSAVRRDELEYCPTPKLQIINENKLQLNILGVPPDPDLTVSVKISDGANSVDVPAGELPGHIVINGADRTVVMDSILEPDAHFYQLFPTLAPGKDLTITVTYSKPGAISSSETITANSLFATRVEGSDGTATVTLAWPRHLQNLENTVSHLDDDAIAIARQTEHIVWEKNTFGDFVSIRNVDANDKLLRYEGNGLEIRELTGTNGLFAVTKNDMELSGIRLVNPQITADSTPEPVGGLVGTAGKGTSITGCGVYYNKLKGDGSVDYNAYGDCGVDGKTNVTGGLVGSADSIIVGYSFAALPKLEGATGGGLIGSAKTCDISNSYSNCDDMLPSFDSFVGGDGGNQIRHCYAVANVPDVEVGVKTTFAAGSNIVNACYYAVSHRDFGTSEDKAATEFSYLKLNDWIETDQKGMADSTDPDGWASDWANMNAPSSHPYREYLDGQTFPYPAITELDHYGSWPEGDGTVDLKITMALLNNQQAGYAIFASRVVVTDMGKTGDNGEPLVLFDSEEHKTADGKFDGKGTVSVTPGTQIKITVSDVQPGYKYVNTTFPDHTGTTQEVTYTVTKETEAIVYFQQDTFRLTGRRAVNNGEYTIEGVDYSIDLTSPEKTLKVANQDQTEPKVETGSTVIVRPNVPNGYFASVVWYTPKDKNEVKDRVYLTQGENGYYSFSMPAQDTDVHVMYTDKEVRFQIKYYLMDTEGKYSTEPTQVINPYRFGLGVQVNQGMIKAMADSSGLPLTLNGERVRYLESAIVTGRGEQKLFECKMDKNGQVTDPGTPFITQESDLDEGENYIVHVYIARKKYRVTLTAEEHINGVRFGDTGEYQNTVEGEFYYGAKVTASADVAPGYGFSYWDPQTSKFLMSAETDYTFEIPAFDLDLRAMAARNRHLVTINLLENDESWLYSSESRQADPITLTLVSSADDTKIYPMKVLTDDTVSYAMQAVVPAIDQYEQGYYVRVDYASGRRSWIYESGNENGTDEGNQRRMIFVRDKAAEETAKFYTLTYFPNKKNVSGTVPEGGTFPMYYHVTVEGNSGLLRNLTDEDKIFSGWKDHYAEGTGSDYIYTGGEQLMLTRRTDMFAQWVNHLVVTYHAGEAEGGELPVDRKGYAQGETVHIQRGSLKRRGYTFLGWSRTEGASTPEFTESGQMTYILQTTDLHLYPVWRLEDYTIRFYNADGTALEGEGYAFTNQHYGDVITAPTLTVEDQSILGWSLTRGGDVAYQPGAAITVTGNQNFYARLAVEHVQVTFKSADGGRIFKTEPFGKGIPGYLNFVPESGPVTAWSTEQDGKGVLYFCRDDGRSEESVAFTENTTLYAVTGKVYDFNQQEWYDTLYDAVRSGSTVSGDTLIVYRDTVESYNIWLNKSLYVISSGNRRVKWKDGATVDSGDKHRLDDKSKETSEFVGVMSVSNNGSPVTVTFGRSDIPTLSMNGNTLVFDANEQSRVIALGNKATFNMYDGITLTKGNRERADNTVSESSVDAKDKPGCRSYYGGGVYAGLESVFHMYGGTISYCTAFKGGGVYLFAKKDSALEGSNMQMGDMVTPTAYSETAIYYEKDEKGYYVNAEGPVTSENYKNYYIAVGNPMICYNKATREYNSSGDIWSYNDGGGGLLMLDLKDGDLVLYKGSIHNNTANANGGGLISDAGDTTNGIPGNEAKLRIYEVDISHNTAGGYGGGIFQWQGVVYIYNSTLRQNVSAHSGGGIYLHHWDSGGTAYDKSTVEFHYGDIADNHASQNGGGIYVESRQLMTVTHGNLMRNTAGENGGGIFVEGGRDPGRLALQGGTVVDNTAANDGGGVYSNGTIELSGGTVSGNHSENCGGGIMSQGDLTMKGGTICNNSAKYLGGGIMQGGNKLLALSRGSLYGNTDTDYSSAWDDEDNVNPGPNDIYLMGEQIITIPDGGIDLSGEERVAVDCERDKSLRFGSATLPHRFAVYANEANFKEKDTLLFTYYGTRSTEYSINTLHKADLRVMSHQELMNQTPSVNRPVGLYFDEITEGNGISSYVNFDFNFPECVNLPGQKYPVGKVLNLSDESEEKVVEVPERPGYYLVGWARTPDALEEQYELYYDVVEDVWRSDYIPGAGWKNSSETPEYTVQNLFSQTLYAMWQPCVVVYDLNGADAHGVKIQPTSVGPKVTLLNPEPPRYKAEQEGGEEKEYIFKHWVDMADGNTTYMPTQQLDLTKNLRLKAIWEERPADTVLITLNPNGGAFTQLGQVYWQYPVKKYESSPELPDKDEVTKARKQLIGWDTDPNATVPHYLPNSKVERVEVDMTLYAIWVDLFDVTYDLNGGVGPGSVVSVVQGESTTIPDTVPEKPGNRFLGWSEKADATKATYKAKDKFGPITSNRTLYAVWEREELYQVTFDANGGAWEGEATQTVQANNANDARTPETLPIRKDYYLLGWARSKTATAAEYAPTDTIRNLDQHTTYYAVWIPAVTITYDLNGGSGSIAAQAAGRDLPCVITDQTPTREYCTFQGWNTMQDGSGDTLQPKASITPSEDITLYAIWQRKTCTVTFHLQEGQVGDSTADQTQTVNQGETLAVGFEATKNGYRLVGWANTAGGNAITEIIPTEDAMDLYAVWQKTCIVTLDLNGPTGTPESHTVDAGQPFILPEPRWEEDGTCMATFLGWAKNDQESDPENLFNGEFTPTEDVTLYAIWQRERYIVSYYVADETDVLLGTETVKIGDQYALVNPNELSSFSPYAQCTFLGWSEDPNNAAPQYSFVTGDGESRFDPDTISLTGDIKLYAIMEKFTITFNLDYEGATPYPDISNFKGIRYVVDVEDPVREGHQFLGWQLPDGAILQKGESYEVQDNTLTLTAKWEPQKYTVTFSPDGGEFTGGESQEATYGEPFTMPNAAKEGHVFLGWERSDTHEMLQPGQTVTFDANVGLTAKWAVAVTITYDLNGGAGSIADQTAGKDVPCVLTDQTPTREGYTFLGWAEKADETDETKLYTDTYTPKNNITLYAAWGKIKTLTFELDGGTWTEQTSVTVVGNQVYTIPTQAPEKAGYRFAGWRGEPDTQPLYSPGSEINLGSDTTLTAVWEAENQEASQSAEQQATPSTVEASETEAATPPETEPQPTETTPPETEATAPAETEATVPPETEATVPPETEATAPPETEATVPPETEATAPPETEATVPPETEATAPPETEATVPPETEATAPPETEATAPPETEATAPAETEMAPLPSGGEQPAIP